MIPDHHYVRRRPHQRAMATFAKPSIYGRRFIGRWCFKRMGCLRWFKSSSQCNGKDIQTWLSNI